jgi:5'-methylthioadenosine phosphorylase
MGDFQVKVGVIGGTGCGGFNMEHLEKLASRERLTVKTSWGEPADIITTGLLHEVPVVLLGRHGPGHKYNPTNVPYRANIQALKDQGCTHIIATSACGSLSHDMAPGDVVILDQFIDWTTKRISTFFEGAKTDGSVQSKVMHMPMADPFCKVTCKILTDCCEMLKLKHHKTGTMLTIEGPRFSTRAESRMFQMLGANLINMTTSPEATLAREAGIPYATIATVTDFDSWREGEDVAVEMIMEQAKKNQQLTFDLLCEVVKEIAKHNWKDKLNSMTEDVRNSTM